MQVLWMFFTCDCSDGSTILEVMAGDSSTGHTRTGRCVGASIDG